MEALESLDIETIIFGTVIIVVIIFGRIWFYWQIIKLIVEAIKRVMSHKFFRNNVIRNSFDNAEKKIYEDVSAEKLQTFNTDNLDTLKDYVYDMFFKFENAYNNLDYNLMKILSTKELFENYYTGITLDLKTGHKKIIEGIEREKVIIFDLDSTPVNQSLSAMIEISYITYTINGEGYIISGNRDKKITERFEVLFRKDFDSQDITICPNCGANIVGNKCDFCHSAIKNVEFRINSIKRIID